MLYRQQVVLKAASYIGLVDGAGKVNEFTKEWGINGQNWCAAFVSSIFWRLGTPLPSLGGVGGGYLYVPYAIDAARSDGTAVEWPDGPPRPGDPVMFTWPPLGKFGDPGEIGDHTGIVESYDGSDYVDTIEGNTQPSGLPNGVWRRRRHISLVACFWRPPVFWDDIDEWAFTPSAITEYPKPSTGQLALPFEEDEEDDMLEKKGEPRYEGSEVMEIDFMPIDGAEHLGRKYYSVVTVVPVDPEDAPFNCKVFMGGKVAVDLIVMDFGSWLPVTEIGRVSVVADKPVRILGREALLKV